jgi:hypothetical protein
VIVSSASYSIASSVSGDASELDYFWRHLILSSYTFFLSSAAFASAV